MPQNLIVTDRKVYSQFKNGATFGNNLGDFAQHLKGNVMEEVKIIYQLDISWNTEVSSSNPIELLNVGGVATVRRNSGSFIADGFSLGDIVDYVNSDLANFGDKQVIAITDTEMQFAAPVFGTTGTATAGALRGKTELTGLKMLFGLIENNESTNFISKVDGSDQGYDFEGVGEDTGGGRITTFIDGVSSGVIKGWQSGTARARYVSNPEVDVQRFEIEHTLLILPYYTEGQINNILNNVLPDFLLGNNSLKYVAEYNFRRVLSDPNTQKTFTDDQVLGSVGGFNENFNGFPNDYSISNLDYEEVSSSNSADGIIIDSATKVSFRVTSNSGLFVTAAPFIVSHSFLPLESEYENQTDIYRDVWLFDSVYNTVDAAVQSSSIISEVSASLVDANNIDVEFVVTFSASQQLKLADTDSYIIAITVGDSSETNDTSDRVQLLIALNNYEKDADIPGLLEVDRFGFFNHPNDVGGSGFTDVKGWIEDGVVLDFRLFTDLNEGATINGIRYYLAAYNSSTEGRFNLEEVVFPLTSILVPDTPNPIQEIDIDTTRGFQLADGDQFNFFKFSTDSRVLDDQFFIGQLGFKLRWEDWIALPGADTIFFDPSQDNNGLNLRSSNYSLVNGYAIKVFLELDMIKDGVSTTYELRSPDFNVQYYDEDGGTPAAWSGTIKLKTQAGTEIDGIMSDEDTIVEITWVQDSGPVTDISDFYAIHRIEESNEIGQRIEELSSLVSRPAPSGNTLIPLTGETRTKISLVSGEVVTECQIDNSKIIDGVSYKVSGRLGSISNAVPLPADTKLQENGDAKLLESGDFKILD